MKKTSILFAIMLFISSIAISQQVTYQDNWGKQGFTLKKESKSQIIINHSTTSIDFGELEIDREIMKTINVPGVFLPNNEGAPNLPGKGRYIAIPQGAEVSFKVLSSRTVVLQNQEIAPAPRIPLDTEDDPLHYEKDMSIYSQNAYYPKEPVVLSEITKIRGVDVVMLGITPFQYNPVTKELIIYQDLEVEVTFNGGNGQFGEDRLRSKWWDPIINDAIINPSSLPVMDYTYTPSANRTPDYEYVIITVDNPDYLAWADSIKNFRIQQGISTGVVTTTSLGGNTVANIKTYVDNAYSNWDSPPVAFLLLGDYATDATGIVSKLMPHPAGSYYNFASDNYYADVDGDDLPDMVFARITARNASELETMVTKFINYENNPPTSAVFYDKPITALGWQTVRWFQLCSEIVGGYFSNVQGKNPTRINAVYQGNPANDPWSTASRTSIIVDYFGPNGLGYIPATPQELGGFTGGSSSDVTNAINNGSFLLQHRDHGSYTTWGEPYYSVNTIDNLTNVNNELPFIFSINCMTGAYHRSTECFTEKFHRYSFNGQNSGALGLVAASQTSYSFVNDTYVWGIYDNMFPDFMPAYGTTFSNDFVRTAFAHAAGKYFLQQSNWPYNTNNKQVTYRLFHHHGGAFTTLYTEVPQNLTVSHNPELLPTQTSFTVTADDGSFIALTVNNQIIATAAGTGSPVAISIPNQTPGDIMKVTITMQNYFRYSSDVPVTGSGGGVIAGFSADLLTPTIGETVSFTDASIGSPISWAWTFSPATVTYVGGTSATDQNPQLTFDAAGNYTVTLTVTDANGSDVEVKTDYIVASVPIILQLSTGVLTNVGNTWQTVTLPETYISPVVVCAANYSSTNAPAVARVRNASGNTFEVKVQNPQQISLSGYTVHYMVVEEGVFTDAADGVKMEAHKYTSTITDKKHSWVGESKSYSNSYNSPIVLGQVMTANDVDWSVFWTRGSASTNPPSSSAFYTGKHVGEETDAIRSNEEIGYIVIEAGTGTLANVGYSTGIGTDIVYGFNDSPPYIYTLSGLSTAGAAIVSGAAMDGGDGGWPVLYGNSPVSTTSLNLAIDEDQIGDTERNHTSEQVAYIVFEGIASAPVADFSADNVTPDVGATVTFTDSSTENPTSWAWTFSPATVTYVGGTSATDQNPQLTFDAAGNYTVTLTATNAGGSDDEVKTDYIVASSSCPAITSYPYTQNFDNMVSSSPTYGCTNDGSVPLNDCWTNLVGDDIDWDVQSGQTPSNGTGPLNDHSGGGKYLYTESSSCYNHSGNVVSPTFDMTSLTSAQLVFWYNMRGSNMGTMSVQVSTDGGANWSDNVWSLSGDQGTGWFEATVSLDQYISSNVVIRFTGLTGSFWASDMAIDDVVVEGTTAPLTYCTPSFGYGTGYGDFISLVNLETIDNATGASASPFYTYYNTLSTDLVPGNSYALTVSAGTYASGNNISAWIDYNKDGDFAEAERLGDVQPSPMPATEIINFTVPADAILGVTRFRVREVYMVSGMSPCTNYNYGETEDYQVNITGGSDAIGNGLSNVIPDISDEVLIYSNKNVVFIQKPASLTGQIDIYDMIGQRVITKKAGEETTIQIPVYKGLGYYVVRLVLNNQVVVKKVFIEQ